MKILYSAFECNPGIGSDDCGILVDIKSREETVLGFGSTLKK